MPASARTTILAMTVLLAASVLALPGSASASDADAPALPPPSYAAQQMRAGEGDRGNPGYHYAAAHTQDLRTQADGLRVTLSVHRPRQVRGGLGQHSVAQLAVGQQADGSYIEAGWRQYVGEPRLFVYWRPADGGQTCYNFGCGFRPKGAGLRPGSALQPGSEITIAFQHIGHKWWLKVNGTRSGFYPDRLWRGQFTGTDFAQLYGEVYTAPRHRVCADMGNGKRARNARAAYMKDARWLGGPALRLHRAGSVIEVHGYTYLQTSRDSFRYGGPGEC
ncbi:MAG: neprosin family prolyl endopeptidase [Actinomycetota bacterium]|nr:neprosin family prolyl endopeptidase [Actinomycetota bacterium]